MTTDVHGLNAAKLTEITVEDFFDGSLKIYSAHSNVRGIPFIGDGFKEAQRKAMWGVLSRGENAGLISVERLSSHCAAETDYHHGIGSMQGTLVGLAQNFAGTNNLNLLVPEGQFGSRRSHGASAARYINTKLHPNFRALFRKEDDFILEQRTVGDLKIEPKYFIPVLPTILLNGAEGMGTGHATHIFNYLPEDLVSAITQLLDGKKLVDFSLKPGWVDFTGKVERSKETGQVTTTGKLKIENTTTIRITELPVGVESDKFEAFLNKLEDKGFIKSYKNASDDTGFDFIITAPRLTTALGEDELITAFHLVSRDTENLTVWGPDGVMVKYDSAERLLVDFVEWRLERYEERRLKLIEIAKAQIVWYEELIRFITFYLANAQKFRNIGKAEMLKILVDEGFQQPERLLSMSIWTLTKDHAEDAVKKLKNEQQKLATLEADTKDKMYRRELKGLVV